MKKGTQIAYIPDHAEGNIDHPDVEFGFVTSERGDAHFCRYWCKGNPTVLRTQANSELTPTKNLIEHKSVSQKPVNLWLEKIGIRYSRWMQ